MSNEATVAFSGDASGLLKAYKELDAAEENHKKKIREGVKAAREAAAEDRRLKREAEGLTKANETAQEKYNRRIAEAKKHVDAGRISQETYTRELVRQKASLDAVGEKHVSVASSIKSMVMQLGAAKLAQQALTSEFEKYERLKENARQASLTAEQGLELARGMFVADDTVNAQQFDERTRRSAAMAKVSTADYATALADTLSAKGDLSNEAAFRLTSAAFEATPNRDVEGARALSASAGDFSKLGGSQSPEAIMGFLAQSVQAARITSVPMLGKTSFPAVQSGVQSGATIEEAQELFLTLNNLIGDAEGRETSTGAIALIEQMKEFEVKDTADPTKMVRPLAGMSPDQQVAALRADPQLAQQFLDATSFEKKVIPAVRSFVMGDARALAAEGAVKTKVGSMDASADAANERAFADYTAFLQGKGTATGLVTDISRRSTSNIEQGRLDNTDAAQIAAINKVLLDTADAVNLPGIDDLPVIGTRNIMANRAALNRTPEQAMGFARGQLEGLLNAPLPTDRVSSSDRPIVEKQLQLLDAMATEMAKQTRDMGQQSREQLTATRRASGSPLDANSRENR